MKLLTPNSSLLTPNLQYNLMKNLLALFDNVIPNVITLLIHGMIFGPASIFLLDWYSGEEHDSKVLKSIMLSFRIWLPGNYFLLVRDKTNGLLFRIDFEISKLMNIMQKPLVMRPICSIDDILTTSIENSESNWDILSTTPGTFELRRYALECRRLKIYNEFRKGLSGRELKVSRNLLIYTTNRDWNAEILQSFQKLAVPGYYYIHIELTIRCFLCGRRIYPLIKCA